MSQRQREHEPITQPPAAAPSAGDGTGEQARRLLEAGDDAISRALASDSRKYLEANRQTGGQ